MIKVSEFLLQLKNELRIASIDSESNPNLPKFMTEKVIVELEIEVQEGAEGSGKFNFGVVSGGGGGSRSQTRTQKVVLELKPTDPEDLILGNEDS